MTSLILIGLKRAFQQTPGTTTSFQNISIIIPFKNEQENIPDLLNALKRLDYPSDKYEVIFVDDNSSDDSTKFLNQNLMDNYKVVLASDKKYPGKKGVIDEGIQNALFDIIAITDADCEPESHWLKSISEKISDRNDIVFGYSPFKEEKTLINKISSFENFRNFILYFSSVGLGIPYSATSRSIAFRKNIYMKLNGYSNTLETLSGDDDLFIREAVKQKLKIATFRYGNDLVYSKASKSFRDYFKRKSRHLKTSHHYLLKHQILLALWHSVNIFSLYSIVFISLSEWFLLSSVVKMVLDLTIVQKVKSKLSHNFKCYEVIFLQPVYETFLIINFINSIFRKDKWK
ncbi:glycosyltransferase [Ignavibacterium album]|nr:glycosyltransferase [Ignavibacterium album]